MKTTADTGSFPTVMGWDVLSFLIFLTRRTVRRTPAAEMISKNTAMKAGMRLNVLARASVICCSETVTFEPAADTAANISSFVEEKS